MVRKIIYCGQPALNKFILTDFHEDVEKVQDFEKQCVKISAVIYPTQNGKVVELRENALN